MKLFGITLRQQQPPSDPVVKQSDDAADFTPGGGAAHPNPTQALEPSGHPSMDGKSPDAAAPAPYSVPLPAPGDGGLGNPAPVNAIGAIDAASAAGPGSTALNNLPAPAPLPPVNPGPGLVTEIDWPPRK